MLDQTGLLFDSADCLSMMMCPPCRTFLTQNKVPPLALANHLFSDMTWIEEKVCAIYPITAHVTCLFQSSDPAQPKVFHGNTCAHDMNIMSTASVLPQSPADINGFSSVIFIGTLFHVQKHKIWLFLLWLKTHNCMYAHVPLDMSIMDLYPLDGSLPGSFCD
ncbi:hypothetical protein BDR07DRAFT_1453492 [Suillus spraguei]|nr:hypothetical protein BDR07DRAFT_1453492 [Suillus spraguei]